MWALMNALCKSSLGAHSHVTKLLQAENGKKLTSSYQYYISVITDINEKWFVVFEHTINHLSFGYVSLPQLENYFSCFAFFFLTLFFFFVFLLLLSTFKLLNALYSKFERLKISGRTSVPLKSVVPGWADSSQSIPPKF